MYTHLLIGLLLILTAFATTSVKASQPVKILVYDFAFSPEIVKVDNSARAKAKNKDQSEYSRKMAIGKQVAANVADEIVQELRELGLHAEHAKTISSNDNAIVIRGRFTDIEEGNRGRRLLIGFNANSSKVTSDVQFIRVVNAKKRLLTYFQTSEKTIGKPGIIPIVAVGAVAGTVVKAAVVSTTMGAASEINPKINKLAKQTAKDIVAQVKPYFKK